MVVPELIDLEAWRQLIPRQIRRSRSRKFTVLSVCRFYPRKRLDVLLRAAALLRDRIPQLEIRIVGNGPEYQRLRQICFRTGSRTGRALARRREREYTGCGVQSRDVFCLPSVQEGFGIVFLEAMAAGKPIVAARAAAVPEVVRNGILVEPENPEALAEAILRLYRDPDLRNLSLRPACATWSSSKCTGSPRASSKKLQKSCLRSESHKAIQMLNMRAESRSSSEPVAGASGGLIASFAMAEFYSWVLGAESNSEQGKEDSTIKLASAISEIVFDQC